MRTTTTETAFFAPFGPQPTESDRWTLDPERLPETRAALAAFADAPVAPMLAIDCEQPAGTFQFPLLVTPDAAPRPGVGNLTCVRLRTLPRTFTPRLELGRPGTLWVERDRGVDGIVVYARDVPVLAIAGKRARRGPPGLIHLEASRVPKRALGPLLDSVAGSLRGLDMGYSSTLSSHRDLGFLERAPDLVHLDLSGNRRLEDLSPVAKLCELKVLLLMGCPRLKRVTPLMELEHLEELDLTGCGTVYGTTELREARPGLRATWDRIR